MTAYYKEQVYYYRNYIKKLIGLHKNRVYDIRKELSYTPDAMYNKYKKPVKRKKKLYYLPKLE